MIEEENPLEETKEAFLIDQWCYIGSVRENQLFSDIDQKPFFDVDAYNILNRFLKSPKNLKAVRRVSYKQLQSM